MSPEEWEARYPDPEVRAHKRSLATSEPPPKEVTAEDVPALIARGYRRTSNKYGRVSRIDRPDYVEHMAEALRKAPADFMEPLGRRCAANWEDHYRRCFSKDNLELGRDLGKLFPTSGWERVGYLP